eukprot:SAG22_NODE_1735_length_3691_cov_406.903675_2_plen_1071_part_01
MLCWSSRSSSEPIVSAPKAGIEQLYDLDCNFYVPEEEIIRRAKVPRHLFTQFLRRMRKERIAGSERELSCFREHNALNRGVLWQCSAALPVSLSTDWTNYPKRWTVTPNEQRVLTDWLNEPDQQTVLRAGLGDAQAQLDSRLAAFHDLCACIGTHYADMVGLDLKRPYRPRTDGPAVAQMLRGMIDINVIHSPFKTMDSSRFLGSSDWKYNPYSSEEEGQEEEDGTEESRPKRQMTEDTNKFITELPENFAFASECTHCSGIPKVIPIKGPNPINHRHTVKDEFRALSILYSELRIPQTQQNNILQGTARVLGHELEGTLSRTFSCDCLVEGAVGAKALMGLKLWKWARTCPQSLSVVIDAASVGEQKFEGIALLKREWDNKKGMFQFERLALGLVELVDGTDEQKMSKLMLIMDDCVQCFNHVYGPQGLAEYDALSLYDIALCIGYATNDHAESVVSNKFVPFITKLMEEQNGTKEHVQAILLCLNRLGIKGEPLANARRLVVEGVFGKTSTNVYRRKLGGHSGFCHFHKEVLFMVAAAKGMGKFQRAGGEDFTAAGEMQTAMLDADKDHLEGTLMSKSTREIAKLIGKGKFDERLSHPKLYQAARDFYDMAHIHFERVTGTRGSQAVFGNCLATFEVLAEYGDWSVLDWINKFRAKKEKEKEQGKKDNRLNSSILQYAPEAVPVTLAPADAMREADICIAELRAGGIIHMGCFRPLQTYIQSDASQGDMIDPLKDYSAMLDKLKDVRTLDDIPWKDAEKTQLLDICSDPRVMKEAKKAKIQERRVAGVKKLLTPDMPPERVANQDKLVPVILRYMAVEMISKLADLLADKYHGGLFRGEDISTRERKYADEHAGASDAIEKYFGVASFLAETNPNQNPVYREMQLAVMEVSYGAHLADLMAEDRVRAHNIMLACRRFAPVHRKTVLDRSSLTLEQRVTHLENVLAISKQKLEDAAEKVRALENESRAYFRRFTTCSPAERRAELLEMNQTERKKYLARKFDMFRLVHKLNLTDDLRYIWHAGTGAATSLWKQNGQAVSTDQLVARYIKCGATVQAGIVEDERQARAARA